jgi:hypothetical protein
MESSTGIAIAFVAQIAAFSAILGLLTSCTDYSPTRFDLVEEPKTMAGRDSELSNADYQQSWKKSTTRILTPVNILERPDFQAPSISPELPAGFMITEVREELKFLAECMCCNIWRP